MAAVVISGNLNRKADGSDLEIVLRSRHVARGYETWRGSAVLRALNAAGITAGCGGGNYCPNNPVTRGQMAVFLAKALGLQFQ